jgi:hypothetical protein
MVDASAQREAALRDQVATLQQLLGHLQQQQQQQQQQQPQSRPTSRFAKAQPKDGSLHLYGGEGGSKLDEWLSRLTSVIATYELNEYESVQFGTSRLSEAALQWWVSLNPDVRLAIDDADSLAAALRSRFQPVTAEDTAREQLDRLQQGNRPINDYISDFQRLRALIPTMHEADAVHAFRRGLKHDLALEVRKQDVKTVAQAIGLAARIGGLTAASVSSTSNPHGRPPTASVNQMDSSSSNGAANIPQIVSEVINAMRMQTVFGDQHSSRNGGAATNERTNNGNRSQRGGRSYGGRSARPLPSIPGVPAAVVQQRRDDKLCLRCGAADHFAISCPSAPVAFGQGN